MDCVPVFTGVVVSFGGKLDLIAGGLEICLLTWPGETLVGIEFAPGVELLGVPVAPDEPVPVVLVLLGLLFEPTEPDPVFCVPCVDPLVP